MFGNCEFETTEEAHICRHCGRSLSLKILPPIVARCSVNKGRMVNPAVSHLRRRTADEMVDVVVICATCEHRTAEGMCGLLKREGCGSCRSVADFRSKLARGMACPDKRFGATVAGETGET